MQIEPFSIWCAMCKDSLWNLAFDYADSCKDKDYLLMKEFELAVRHYVYESGRKVNVDKNDNN